MAKIKLPKNPIAWLYFEHSKEELIETKALKLTPREKIELEVIHQNFS